MDATAFAKDRPVSPSREITLRECTSRAARRYIADLKADDGAELHAVFVAEMESALIAEVCRHTAGNLTRAARLLGLSRGTLRKKMQDYQLGEG